MYKAKLEQDLKKAVRELGFLATDPVLSISENPKFGDYTTNIALQLSKQKGQKDYHSPKDIASDILEKLGHPAYLEHIEIAGPGFLNFYLKDSSLLRLLEQPLKIQKPVSKNYLVEFAHPNTHKAFHIGHFRNISIGESLSRLLEFSGHAVFRVTYGGDIGPHIAKALWAVAKLKDEFLAVKSKSIEEKGKFLGKAYAYGSKAYDEDPKAKEDIDLLNRQLYARDPNITPIWEETKNWSIGYFEVIYARLGTIFDVQIWESEIEGLGKEIVMENLNRVFVEDQGAIIFPGGKYGLHNRVFITSKGYPTYEGKEMGLTRREQELFPFDYSLHVVDNQQTSFFEVVTKAVELVESQMLGKKRHLPYGFVNLSTGKMSSRTGNVLTYDKLIEQVKEKLKEVINQNDSKIDEVKLDKIAIGAIKFTFLKYSLSSDIAFDVDQSVSIQGDSGVYLLYTFARISSVLNRSKSDLPVASNRANIIEPDHKPDQAQPANIAQSLLNDQERNLLRQIEFFESAVDLTTQKLAPNELANYLLNLAKQFNLFYEQNPILNSKNADFRLNLTTKTGDTIKLALYLLGIETVDKM